MSALLTLVNGFDKGECEYHIQIVQVQDGTSTFLEELQSLREQKLVEHLMSELSEEFGKIEFGLTMYQDKPTTVTGFGQNDGWWSKRALLGTGFHTDLCYDLIQPLTDDAEKANDAFNYFSAGGGKDVMENQWDALRRSVIDPRIGWDLRTHDDDGSPIVRLAVLVTDDAAHTAHNVFKDQPRNLNNEFYVYQGPYNSLSRMGNTGKQECNMDESVKMTNNRRDNPSEAESTMEGGGECFGWSNSIAGAMRSLKGTLGYYNYFYGFGETPRKVDSIECTGLMEKGSPCWDYSAFINCCTHWGNTVSYGCYYDYDMAYRFPDYDSCIDYGGRYARCHYSQGPAGCTADTQEWNKAQRRNPSPEFFTGLGISNDDEREEWLKKIYDIEDYPYDESVFDKDCTTFDYPDPTSPEYAEPFVNRSVIPLIVAAPPSAYVMSSPGVALTTSISSYDYAALRMSEHNCPGLEWDPWTTYMCSRYGESSCYSPNSDKYSGLYPTKDAWVNQEFWKEEFGCWTEECAQEWWSQCYDVEYGYPLSKLEDHGVEAKFQLMDADYDAKIMIDSILHTERETLDEKKCITSTTTTTTVEVPATTTTGKVEPPTTTAVEVPATTTTEKVEPTTTADVEVPATTTTEKVEPTTTTTVEVPATTTTEVVEPTTTTTIEVPATNTTEVVEPTTTTTVEVPVTTTTEAAEVTTKTTTISVETTESVELPDGLTTGYDATVPAETTFLTEVVLTTTSTTTTTTTTPMFEIPPPPPTQAPAVDDDEDNLGVIVGSAVGGAVAVAGAVVAGLMAKGVIPLPNASSPTISPQDVEVQGDILEREVAIEIDADMFV